MYSEILQSLPYEKSKGCVKNDSCYRGNSKTPLYLTAVGIDQDIASGKVQSTYGENRIPYWVKIADFVARKHKIILN